MIGLWACGYDETFCCGAACDFSLISPKPLRPSETVSGIFNSALLLAKDGRITGIEIG